MTPDTSGRTLRVPLAYYDHESSYWRTSGAIFPSDWPTSSQTCPAWGMTRRGELFELPTPVLPTDAPASSSSLPTPRATRGGSSTEMAALLMPTPLASDGEKGGPNQRGGSGDLRLSSAVHLLPTPVADHSRGLPSPTTDYASLPNVVCALLPTPTAMDMGRGRTPEEWDDWRTEMRERHGNGNGHGRSLEIEAQRLLPTPTSRDYKGANQRDDETCLPGALTALRSTAGNESSDGELPGQLSLDEPASD